MQVKRQAPKTKKPQCGNTEASGVKTFDGNHDMNTTTAVSNVIPFAFEAKSVRVQEIDGSPWFCLTDVCSILGYSNSRDAMAKHCREAGVAKRDVSSAGQKRSLTFISEGNLYRLIIKSRKAEAQRFESWVCDEVLPSIRKTGGYVDRHAVMGDLVGAVIGSSGEVVLDRVIDHKIINFPASAQRSLRHTMKSRLRSRFNVQRTALIPAENLADACNFVAAYVIEGEFIAKPVSDGVMLTREEARDLYHTLYNIGQIQFHREALLRAGRALQSDLLMSVFTYLHECQSHLNGLNKQKVALDERFGSKVMRGAA